MKKMIKLCLALFLSISLFFCLSDIAQAGGKGNGGYRSSGRSGYKSSGSGSKSIKIKNYYRKDRTYYVPSHSRSAPSSKSTTYTPSKPSKISAPSPKSSSMKLNKSSKNSTLSSTTGVKRDSKGRIERSSKAKKEFLKSKDYDKVPEGYEVDHIIPLYKGGADEPSNMQLLPKDMHKQKTKMDLEK